MTEMLFGDSKNPTDEEGEEESEVVKEAMRAFMEKYVQRLRLFDLKSKLMVVRLCKNLRVLNLEFGDHIKMELQRKHKQMSLSEILLTMAYLADCRSIPHEFFYRHKQEWFKMINRFNGKLLRTSEPHLLRLF